MFRTVDKPKLLDWMKRTFGLSEQVRVDQDQFFGPYTIRGRPLHVRYTAETCTWEMFEAVDESFENFMKARSKVIELAEKRRGHLPRGEFVKELIRACIANGITTRATILDSVDLAANQAEIRQSLETGSPVSDPTFTEKFVAGVLARHRGSSPDRHLWWIDEAKVYHLH